MKVLFVIHSLGGGGAERILVDIANSLAHNHDVTVMTIVDGGINREKLSEYVRYRSFIRLPKIKKPSSSSGESSGSLLAGGSSLKNFLARLYEFLWRTLPTKPLYAAAVDERYDVEVSFLEGICAKFVASSNNPSSRKVCWIHVDVAKEPKSHNVFRSLSSERRTYEAFDSIVAVSAGVRKSFEACLGFEPGTLEVCRNPINVRSIRESSLLPLEKGDGGLFQRFTFCSIGRLCEQKAFDRLIKAASVLKRRGEVFSVLILGEGKLEKDLRALVEAEGVEDCVHLLGFRSNPYPVLAKADCYVCTSIAEGMSTTVSEAMVLGLPIITTNCAGSSELMEVAHGRIVGESIDEIASAMSEEMASSPGKGSVPQARIDAFFDESEALRSVERLICG